MGAERARATLSGTVASARGVTFLDGPVLEALFWGKASGPAEALAALAEQLDLDVAFVPGAEPWAHEALERLANADVASAWVVDGVLGRVARESGWAQALAMSASDPSGLAGALAEALHDALVEAREGITSGADVLVVADDLAGEMGWLVSPDFALDALLPSYRSLAAEAAGSAVPAVFHSDGDIRSLLPALARAGFVAVHPGGLSVDGLTALAGVARMNGLVMIGGLPARELLPGTALLADFASSLASGGAVIVADDGGIASVEEAAAFVSAMRAVVL